PDDQLLLSEGDSAYLDVKPGHDVAPGDELTIFRPLKSNLRGDAKGPLVAILGTARVEKFDPPTRFARVRLTESLDIIASGSVVGRVRRRCEVVPPERNEVELWGHVAASLYPHVLYGQNQVVFIDKGQQDGLVPGNRLFVVTRGDEYRKTLVGASEFAASHVQYENEEPAKVEKGGALGTSNDAKHPEEVIGDIRVVSVKDHTAACLVIASSHEIEPGQRIVARKGYWSLGRREQRVRLGRHELVLALGIVVPREEPADVEADKASEKMGAFADPHDARGRVDDHAVRRDERVDRAAIALRQRDVADA